MDLAIPHELVLAFETLIFILTLWKSWSMREHYRHVPLLKLLLRDDKYMNSFVCVATLFNVVTFYPYMRNGLVIFEGTVSISMISRIIINLHKSVDAPDTTSYSGSVDVDHYAATYHERAESSVGGIELDTLAHGLGADTVMTGDAKS
ncbi:hypothetical protein D9758_010359 [Tetrapyrgos nigripes]|uniref:Uncharacterized protein n=1 Tax=Tetrapyrgos nigripes TaxID=182062 RepID=A0A8H5CZL0_9AGAR|nr:hypothetical protein D9758_010359 [Tetrapyrgos nigripes]